MTLDWTTRAILKKPETVTRYEEVEKLRAQGMKFKDIGEKLGVSRQRAQMMMVSLRRHRERVKNSAAQKETL
jgi:hypothetical protein